jgi:AcrR family transcriptional regulator
MIDPTALIEVFTRSVQSPVKPAKSAGTLRNTAPYQFPTTYDDVRDALIAASEYVISRTGVHRATVSRIARRAGVSVGAIYGLYENKDALVADCLEVLFPPQSRRDVEEWSRVFAATDQRAVVTDILANYMSPSFAQWRTFRLESIVAARHSPDIASQLATYTFAARRSLLAAAVKAPPGATISPDTGLSARASVLGLSILEVVDPTICQLDWRWIPFGQ